MKASYCVIVIQPPLLIRHIVPRRVLKFDIGLQSGDDLRANSFEQNEFRLGRVEQDHRQGFDQPNCMDGGDDLLLFAGLITLPVKRLLGIRVLSGIWCAINPSEARKNATFR